MRTAAPPVPSPLRLDTALGLGSRSEKLTHAERRKVPAPPLEQPSQPSSPAVELIDGKESWATPNTPVAGRTALEPVEIEPVVPQALAESEVPLPPPRRWWASPSRALKKTSSKNAAPPPPPRASACTNFPTRSRPRRFRSLGILASEIALQRRRVAHLARHHDMRAVGGWRESKPERLFGTAGGAARRDQPSATNVAGCGQPKANGQSSPPELEERLDSVS